MNTRRAYVWLAIVSSVCVIALAVSGCATPRESGRSNDQPPAASPSAAESSGDGPALVATSTPPKPSVPPSATSRPISGLHAASVVRVVDGDTAIFSISGRTERVRFIGVDTPESTTQHEPYGEQASQYTKMVLKPGLKTYLEYDAELRDRYGRLLAYVWLEAPTSRSDAQLRAHQFNARLLLRGYAQQMTIQPNSKYADYYTVYAREARENARGLWSLPTGAASGSSGTAARVTSGAYVGSRRSHKFHKPSCQWGKQIAPANLVVFKTRAAAVNAGYVPCKVCKP